jgi:membrane protein DedA with SNARE-associated domain
VEKFAQWLVDFVHDFGYLGIFIMAFLESTFAPIPSEVTMVPAGYLVHQGKMNLWIIMITSVLGAIGGSLANYWIAYHYGRRFLYAYGKYLFFNHDKMQKLDDFFAAHGEISTLTGRLVPGLRHVISFPAGLAHMDLKKFSIYTGVGSAIWMAILVWVGYLIGGNKELVRHWMPYVVGAVVLGAIIMIVVYVWHHRKNVAAAQQEAAVPVALASDDTPVIKKQAGADHG